MYPTAEQAAAAAMALTKVGDRVCIHEASCATQNDVGCDCRLLCYLNTGEGFRLVPYVDPAPGRSS